MSLFGKIKTATTIAAGVALLSGCDSEVNTDPSANRILPSHGRETYKFEIKDHDLLKFAGIEKLDRSNSGKLLKFINSSELAKPEVLTALQDFLKKHSQNISTFDPVTWMAIEDSAKLMEATGVYIKALGAEGSVDQSGKLLSLAPDAHKAIGTALALERNSRVFYSKDGSSLTTLGYSYEDGKTEALTPVARINPETRKDMLELGAAIFKYYRESFQDLSFDSVAEYNAAEAGVQKTLEAFGPALNELEVSKSDVLRGLYGASIPQLLEKADELLCDSIAVAHSGHADPKHTAEYFSKTREQILEHVCHLGDVIADSRVQQFLRSEEFNMLRDRQISEYADQRLQVAETDLARPLPTSPKVLRGFASTLGRLQASYDRPSGFSYRFPELTAQWESQTLKAGERVTTEILPLLDAEAKKITALKPETLPVATLTQELERLYHFVATASDLNRDFEGSSQYAAIQSKTTSFLEAVSPQMSQLIGIGLAKNGGADYDFERGKILYLAAGLLNSVSKLNNNQIVSQPEIECLMDLAGPSSKYFPVRPSQREVFTSVWQAGSAIAAIHSSLPLSSGGSSSSFSSREVGLQPSQACPEVAPKEAEAKSEAAPDGARQ